MAYEFDWPVHDHREKEALLGVLERHKWFDGEEVARFEKAYAAFQGGAFGVACTSGTTAIEVVLEALEIGPGDEVIVPPYTFVATATAVLRVGATPVFADIDASWCMDPVAAEVAISPKTKAIMPVHFGGSMANIEALRTLAQGHNLKLIEDACHAWGSCWNEQGAGTVGCCGVFSFQESKNITAGEGGIIVTNDGELAARCRSIVNCGREEGAAWYHHVNLGTNARLTEFGAALLRVQLERYPGQMATRTARAATLDDGLGTLPGISPQPFAPGMTRRSYHLYCIRFDAEQFGMGRDAFLRAVEAAGLPIVAGYPLPLYKQPLFQKFLGRHNYDACQCPVTEALCAKEGLWIQQTVLLLSESHMASIVDGIASIQSGAQ